MINKNLSVNKKCIKCKKVKSIYNFEYYINGHGSYCRSRICIECVNMKESIRKIKLKRPLNPGEKIPNFDKIADRVKNIMS